ncbi:hypothetical protein BGZ99_003157 [Dissophora globulifera]|uniref:Effector protein n=1 Tax=Dissophora globulifera TaxID=979702 RepID=A0A9P6RQQ6_9FUNG|nr:hypothetical protein BGZ99_003157 [Dissophora globulifera]
MTKILASLLPLAIAFLSVASAKISKRGTSGQVASVQSQSDFCFFLPPMFGGGISQNEDRAVAFCTTPLAKAPGARIFPSGFIQSAHFATGNGYVQVTGRIQGSAYGLSASDGGGQYDRRAPVGASCAGYNYFVNLIEPNNNIYCMRCCNEKKDCNTGKSEYGCEAVISGNYS